MTANVSVINISGTFSLIYELIRMWYRPSMEPGSLPQLSITSRERIEILLEEYRALNVLLVFRLTAMDRRLPVSAAIFAGTVATVGALPNDSKIAFLLATPLAVLWMIRTTVQHACAKEDHLRRIDEIERLVNLIAGQDLLAFQSRHPNRGTVPAGRSGQSTVLATAASGLVLLGICVFLFIQSVGEFPVWPYLIYATGVGIDVALHPILLGRYRYRKATGDIITST
jgi:hypothetical protein